ncbi:AAA family ATPase [Devosia sp. Root105]|uniref:ATP-binding protein n=1 Tax=Devosia sp. Root105 TaxID=1736423 RepID=UPI0006FE716A|nr:AAA family ATPase [Devosia sp. Root105]KQV09504.1 LuxR family transcriptional regulator [Devosia sp. Root105]
MSKLLERSAPLDVLSAVRERTAAGHGGTVLIEGEAGIGKTTLLQEFAEQHAGEFKVAWGWCEALFTPRPLGPLHDMGRSIGTGIAALLEQSAPPDRLFPALLNKLQDDGDPLILIFEDVHWADNATLDLVKYLGRRIGLLRAMVVLTARSDEIGPTHPLSYVLGDLPAAAVTRIKLGPLSPAAVHELAIDAGRSSDDLYRVTAGNPFFVTELLATGGGEPGSVPDSIRDAVWSRLARLTPGERDVLEMMSIVPGNMELGLIKALLGPDAEDLVDMAVGRGLLRRDPQGDISFRHELARRATLDRLSSSLQRSLHTKVEAALAALPGQDSMLHLARRVHHAAGAEDGAGVLDLAPRAAAQASRLGAHQQAASFLQTALEYADIAEPAVAAQLHESWAYEASLGLFDYNAIIASHHRAISIWRELGNSAKISLNYRLLSRLHWRRGEGAEARNFADLAVEEVEGTGPGPELAMAYSTRSQLNMLHYRFAEAIDWGRRAIRLADELGVVETRVHALNNVGTAMLFDTRPGGREVMEEGLSLALQHGFHDHAARAYTNFAEHAVVSKDFELAERLLAEGIAFAARHDLDSSTQYLLGRQAQLRMEQGRLREAETIAQGVIGMERLPVVMHLPALTVLGRVRMRMNLPDGERALLRALDEGLPTGEPQRIFPVRIALVEAAWLREDLDAARQQLTELTAIDLSGLRAWDLGELAAWWRRSSMPGDVPARVGELPAPWALELAGQPARAAAEWTGLGLPYEAGIASMQVAGVDAGTALGQAIAMFEAIEARQAAALARRLAQRLGLGEEMPKSRRGPYASSRQHPLGLTQSEHQVLQLIADGKSNKDIARHLSRSPRTIEHQVSAVLGKFSAANRIEVMLRLRTEPWLLTPVEAGRL